MLGDMSTLLLDSQFMVPSRLLEAGFMFKFGNIREALQNLYRQ
jgi:NAD dependent epimerase/dehydratase family enzyme